jgi:hypothetical protein
MNCLLTRQVYCCLYRKSYIFATDAMVGGAMTLPHEDIAFLTRKWSP